MERGAKGWSPCREKETLIRAVLWVALSLILAMRASAASAASIVTEWLDQALPYAQEVAWEPTVGSRFLATLHTAMYDAWTAYDSTAVGVVSGTALKGEGGPNNEANKREAISHAAFCRFVSARAPASTCSHRADAGAGL
jgi:hypothetical protein